ncbi:low-density lipoprotein receptor-related protein 1B-like isoform X15 [Eriocheir sinensis]|uniref:low-density lipoprotein receptor-related protein 1B-like isoform X15 n=1 Tax=Eriocheir sinensis TaxID=95602 RepID=UPI0021CAA19D|nr:low-density lipoprotein receptor-related protein 1B-like isoform X15 [Eriocheir sinensis]
MAGPLVSMAVRRLILTALLASCLAHALLQDDEDLTFDDEDHAARSRLGESVAPVSAPHEALEDSLKPLVRTRRQFGRWFGGGGNTVDDVDAEEGSALEEGSAYGSRTYRVKIHVLTAWENQYGSRESNDYQVLARRIESALAGLLLSIDGEKSYKLAKCSRSPSRQIMAWVDIMHEDPADQKDEVQRRIRSALATGRLNDLSVNNQYYEFSEPLAPACQVGEWKCPNGRCVPQCDGTAQCRDGSDEEYCATDGETVDGGDVVGGCPGDSKHTCPDGKVICNVHLCDGDCQCVDCSDETGCGCNEGQFLCDDIRCLEENTRCDGVPDCVDGTDEKNCTAPPPPTTTTTPLNCLGDQTPQLCSDGVTRNCPCDGIQQCSNGEDERNCRPDCPFPGQEYRCGDEDTCLYDYQLCDGRFDCFNRQDEANCPTRPPVITTTRAPTTTTTTPLSCLGDQTPQLCSDGVTLHCPCDGINQCPNNEDERNCRPACPIPGQDYRCGDEDTCLYEDQLCNGVNDCFNGLDEDEATCRPDCPDPAQARLCGDQEDTCLFQHQVCDRNFDCLNGADEANCDACEHPKFQCISLMCIPPEEHCNGIEDCDDGSDEIGCPCRDKFTCRDGQCVASDLRCDGKPHCDDGSDEMDCVVCEGDAFLCGDGSCLEAARVCDGVQDCDADEEECDEGGRK